MYNGQEAPGYGNMRPVRPADTPAYAPGVPVPYEPPFQPRPYQPSPTHSGWQSYVDRGQYNMPSETEQHSYTGTHGAYEQVHQNAGILTGYQGGYERGAQRQPAYNSTPKIEGGAASNQAQDFYPESGADANPSNARELPGWMPVYLPSDVTSVSVHEGPTALRTRGVVGPSERSSMGTSAGVQRTAQGQSIRGARMNPLRGRSGHLNKPEIVEIRESSDETVLVIRIPKDRGRV